MKFICTRDNLKTGLAHVARLASSSSTLPILSYVMIETENGLLKLTATNLELSVQVYVRGKVENDGIICVPVRALSEIVGVLPEGNISCHTDDPQYLIIESGGFVSKMKYVTPEEFPNLPVVEYDVEVVIPSKQLLQGISDVYFAVSRNETQPEISGVLVVIQDSSIIFVATDRYRLSEKKIALQGNHTEKRFILPYRACVELLRYLNLSEGEVVIGVSHTQIHFRLDNILLSSRMIDGEFPDYTQIIPHDFSKSFEVPSHEFSAAVRLSNVFSSGIKNVHVKFSESENIIELSSGSQDIGESSVKIPGKVKGEGSLVLNASYLLDFLTNVPEKDIICFINESDTPVVFKNPQDSVYMYLIMPIFE